MTARAVVALVEVRADAAGAPPLGLVHAAYRASREGTIVLILDGVSPAQVDRALDPLVPRVPGVAGVVYSTPATLEPVLQRSGWPGLAFLGTPALARALSGRGVRVLPVEQALGTLGEWAATAVAEVAS